MALIRLHAWLEREETFGMELRYVALACCASLILLFGGPYVYSAFDVYLPREGVVDIWALSSQQFISQVVPIIVNEELYWRFLPLTAPIFFGLRFFISPAVFISSAHFGYMHGGLLNIPLQGVGGLILCLVFLKCGGMRMRFFRAIGMVILTHLLIDAVLYLRLF